MELGNAALSTMIQSIPGDFALYRIVKGKLKTLYAPVFCQAKIPKIAVKIPCFHNGKFPVISGMWQQEPVHA